MFLSSFPSPHYLNASYAHYFRAEILAEQKRKKDKETEKLQGDSKLGRVYVDFLDTDNTKVFRRVRTPSFCLCVEPGCLVCAAFVCVFRGDHRCIVSTKYQIPPNLPPLTLQGEDVDKFEKKYTALLSAHSRKQRLIHSHGTPTSTSEKEDGGAEGKGEGEEEDDDEEEEEEEDDEEEESDDEGLERERDERETKQDCVTHHNFLFPSFPGSLPLVPKFFFASVFDIATAAKSRKEKSRQDAKAKAKEALLSFPQWIRLCIKFLRTSLFHQSAALNSLQLLPHQIRFRDWFSKTYRANLDGVSGSGSGSSGGGALYFAACASGKTKGALATLALQRSVRKVLIVTTNTMIAYWKSSIKEVWEFLPDDTEFTIMGYTAFVKMCETCSYTAHDYIRDPSKHLPPEWGDTVVVLDEGQYLRNAMKSKGMIRALYVLLFSKLTLVLTGTPLMNSLWGEVPCLAALLKSLPFAHFQTSLTEYQSLLEDLSQKIWRMLSAPSGDIDGDKKEREKGGKGGREDDAQKMSLDDLMFQSIPTVSVLPPKLVAFLRAVFQNKTCFYDPQVNDPEFYAKHFPKLEHIRRPVEMSWIQTLCYLLGKRNKIKFGEASIESSSRNSYGSQEKKISNYCAEEGRPSNKVEALVADLLWEEFGSRHPSSHSSSSFSSSSPWSSK